MGSTARTILTTKSNKLLARDELPLWKAALSDWFWVLHSRICTKDKVVPSPKYISLNDFIYLVSKGQIFLELLGTENLTKYPLGAVLLWDKAEELKDMVKWISYISLNYRMDSEWYNEEDVRSV